MTGNRLGVKAIVNCYRLRFEEIMKGRLGVRQLDSYDCGAASLCSIARYYGVRLPVSEVRRVCGCTGEGITIKGIMDGAASLGFEAKGYKAESVSEETLSVIAGPVIAHMKREDGYLHYVVIYGVGRKKVTVMEPGCGKMVKIRTGDFLSSWTGYIITVAPSVKSPRREDSRGNNPAYGLGGVGASAPGEVRSGKYRRLAGVLLFHRREILLALYGSVILTLTGICNSIFLRHLIDDVIPSGDMLAMAVITSLMLVLIPVQLFIGYLRNLYLLRNGIKIDTQLIMGFLGKLMRMPVSFFREYGSGDLESRISDACKIRSFISEGLVSLFVSAATIVAVGALMFTLYWKMALCTLLFMPFYGAIYFFSDRINRRYSREIAQSAARFENNVIDTIDGAESIKHFGAEGLAAAKYNRSYSIMMEKVYKAGRYGAICGAAGSGVSAMLLASIIIVGGFHVCGGGMTTGELVSFYTLSTLLIAPIVGLIDINSLANEALTASERLFEIIGMKDEGEVPGGDFSTTASEWERILGSGEGKKVEFRNVTFRYPGREDLIRNLNCCFESGFITAVCGPNGAGKSTVGALLMRDLHPLGGTIGAGGADISSCPADLWRKHISIAPQRGHVFDATVLDNITSGMNEADYKTVKRILGAVGLEDFCRKHPLGPLTMLGRNGCAISGGEMQKIMIARMLYRNPDIMVFDEATSFMDEASEKRILELMRELKVAGKCIVLITHKSSNLAVADRIIRL